MFPAAGKGEIRVDRPARIAVEFLVLLVVALLGLPGDASAGSQTWSPPEPSPEDKDWVRLKSGEWLMGEIQILRDTDFEFDSDELDLLKLDWKDVVELRSPRILTYRFDDLGVFSGSAVMKEGIVAIRTGDKVREFPRECLLLILEGNPNLKNTYHHANGVLSVDVLGDILDFDVSATWDRTESPQADAEGNVPNRDDLRISFGLGVEF